MQAIQSYKTVANGAAGTIFFGPFNPGDELLAIFAWLYHSDDAATIRMGMFATKDATNFQGKEFASDSAMLLPDLVASLAGDPAIPTMVLFPIGELVEQDAPYIGIKIDNTGGAGAVTGLFMLQVSKGVNHGLAVPQG